MEAYLLETSLLNYSHLVDQGLIAERGWKTIRQDKVIEHIYIFVRDELPFGYNSNDVLQASTILSDGYGQCNYKRHRVYGSPACDLGTVPTTWLYYISKELQKGALTGLAYLLSPSEIIHSWVEVYISGRWIDVELSALKRYAFQVYARPSMNRNVHGIRTVYFGKRLARGGFRGVL